jgi:hypothetical protein
MNDKNYLSFDVDRLKSKTYQLAGQGVGQHDARPPA